jgi:hypothetical protein
MVTWSIISMAAGMSPLAITAETASEACSIESKTASTVLTACDCLRMRTTILVAMPKVPSEPTKRPAMS